MGGKWGGGIRLHCPLPWTNWVLLQVHSLFFSKVRGIHHVSSLCPSLLLTDEKHLFVTGFSTLLHFAFSCTLFVIGTGKYKLPLHVQLLRPHTFREMPLLVVKCVKCRVYSFPLTSIFTIIPATAYFPDNTLLRFPSLSSFLSFTSFLS